MLDPVDARCHPDRAMPASPDERMMRSVTFIALTMAVAAIALLVAGISNIFKGHVGVGALMGVIALIIGSGAGAVAAYV